MKSEDNNFEIEVNVSPMEDTVWLTQKQINLLSDARSCMDYHINNLFKSGQSKKVLLSNFSTKAAITGRANSIALMLFQLSVTE